jgi:hypothetical protein
MYRRRGKPVATSEKMAVEMAGEMAGKAKEKSLEIRLKKIVELIKVNPEITKPPVKLEPV